MGAGYARIDRAQLARLLEDPDGPVGREVARVTLRGEGIARRLLGRPGAGRVYRRYRPRRVHRASAPGQPPATDTGRGRSAVAHELGVDARGVFGRFGTSVVYLRYLEFGTETIRPRPWLRPTLDRLARGGDG